MSWRVEAAVAVAVAVVELITVTLPTDPERTRKQLRGEPEGLRSARRGDYRVLFELSVPGPARGPGSRRRTLRA